MSNEQAKHTPGPWFANFEAGRYVISYQGEFGPYRALAITGGFHPDHEANARLIAAAPELLSALEEVVSAQDQRFPAGSIEEQDKWATRRVQSIEAARAAIAKATGSAS